MMPSEYSRYRELRDNIYNALADNYPDETPDKYEFAVNPHTYEVIVVDCLDDVPDGWIYECIVDAEWDTICACASQYFDFRR